MYATNCHRQGLHNYLTMANTIIANALDHLYIGAAPSSCTMLTMSLHWSRPTRCLWPIQATRETTRSATMASCMAYFPFPPPLFQVFVPLPRVSMVAHEFKFLKHEMIWPVIMHILVVHISGILSFQMVIRFCPLVCVHHMLLYIRLTIASYVLSI